MATIKFDRIAQDFVGRIPTQFKSTFTPGTMGMPATFVLTADQVINFINRALQKLFNDYWKEVKGDVNTFINIFPELAYYTPNPVQLLGGIYTIATPYLDFYKIINGRTNTSNKFIKPWDTTKYSIALTQEYTEYIATDDNPAIIQVNNFLAVFPNPVNTGDGDPPKIKFQYVKLPLDPTTGNFLTQNGSYDSPYYDHWNKAIADIAYLMYLEETNQTA